MAPLVLEVYENRRITYNRMIRQRSGMDMFFHGYEGGEVRTLRMGDLEPGEGGLSLGFLYLALFYHLEPGDGVPPGRIFYFPAGVDPPRLCEVVHEDQIAKIMALYRPGVPVPIYTESAHPRRHIPDLLEDPESVVDNDIYDDGGEADSDED